MNILFISNLFPPHFLGGYEILCSQVKNLLEKRGHRITVLTSDHLNSGEPANTQEHGILRRLKLFCPFAQKAGKMRVERLKTAVYNFRFTRNLLKYYKPDIVFVWSQLRLTPGAALAAQKAGFPVVFTFNDDHIAGYGPEKINTSLKGLANWLLDKTVMRQATVYDLDLSHSTCISQRLKDQICEKGVDIRNSKVIYQGIPLEKFPLREIPPNIPTRSPKILYAGQLHHYKGVHTLIKAVNLLPEGNYDSICLNIAGDGPADYRSELKSLSESGRAQVNFLGRRPVAELPELYRSHDLFVFPSIWPEPFGLTHLEAMASGTPVVSTRDGGHGEFLVDEDNALIFQKDDEKDLARQIDRLLQSQALAEKLSNNARKMVENRFTLDRYVDDLEKWLYERVK
ncbi:MAG: glycosyltransferase family 4 protein [Candidatus Rifleibacteriota bacterium]